jgi:hypothetical protein
MYSMQLDDEAPNGQGHDVALLYVSAAVPRAFQPPGFVQILFFVVVLPVWPWKWG